RGAPPPRAHLVGRLSHLEIHPCLKGGALRLPSLSRGLKSGGFFGCGRLPAGKKLGGFEASSGPGRGRSPSGSTGARAMIEIPPSLLEILRKADRVAVLTGAGISAESGIPTFRDAQTGLWASFRPEELATREAFEKNPRRVWEWYAHRRDGVQKAEPNDGHRALVEMEKRFSRFTLITQNVDGLHRRAGSRALIELHGNIARSKCFSEEIPVESWKEDREVPPRCPRCGGFLRPDVVW